MQTMKPSAALDALNTLLQTHSVEEAAQHPGAMHPGITFRYLNTGDTYTPTIVRYNGHYYVTSWGDVVESLAQDGMRRGSTERISHYGAMRKVPDRRPAPRAGGSWKRASASNRARS